MLRIHAEETLESTTLRLEGKLIHPWSDELVEAWMKLRARGITTTSIQIDLDAVSFVDERGRSALMALWRSGARVPSRGVRVPARPVP